MPSILFNMNLKVDQYRYTSRKKRKKNRFLLIPIGVTIIAVIFIFRLDKKFTGLIRNSKQNLSITELWNNRSYNDIIAKCEDMLLKEPMRVDALAFRGFSFFYKAVTVNSLEDTYYWLDESVKSLRKASLVEENNWLKEIDYILGKAYYHKGIYYFNSSIKYLVSALNQGFEAIDIYEFLGNAYIQLEELDEGVKYFKIAVEKFGATEKLLLTIGMSYYQMDEIEEAMKYLSQTIALSDDREIIKRSRFILGDIYFNQKDYYKALEQYQEIINLDPQSADSHFYMGEIYAALNDIVHARNEWRSAYNINPGHEGARLRLSP